MASSVDFTEVPPYGAFLVREAVEIDKWRKQFTRVLDLTRLLANYEGLCNSADRKREVEELAGDIDILIQQSILPWIERVATFGREVEAQRIRPQDHLSPADEALWRAYMSAAASNDLAIGSDAAAAMRIAMWLETV